MGSWEVMKIRGIPLRIHPSWFLVFLYFTLSAKDQFETLLNGQASIWNGWVIGASTSSLLFLSVLLHELAHSFVAIGEGLKVRDITLFLLGGMVNLEKECKTSKGSLKIALSGPIVSILLGAFMIIVGNFLSGSLLIPILLRRVGHIRVFAALASLASIAILLHSVLLDPYSWFCIRIVDYFK